MWISRKSKGNTLDMLILSILDHHQKGMTGYAVMKELEEILHPIPVPGTGTIYPRLDNLVSGGDIAKQENLYQITTSGKQKIEAGIENIIEQNLQFTRSFFRGLLSRLPLSRRTHYTLTFPRYFQFFSNETPDDLEMEQSDPKPIFDEDSFQCHWSGKIANSLDDLKLAKYYLERAKITIKKNMKSEIAAINQRLASINDQIQKIEEEKASWTKIPIEDEYEE